MTSYRPKDDPTQIDFSHEALKDCFVSEPQRGQSNMADVEKTALGSETLNLMEQVVHWGNTANASIWTCRNFSISASTTRYSHA